MRFYDNISLSNDREANMQADIIEQAPDFTLADIKGIPISLEDFKGKANVVLVLNRGFL